jgi:nucleotide-binding universal stress UspA family protein
MPFLRAAEAVEVACVVDRSELPDTVAGAEIAPHLSRHGVAVTVTDLPAVGNVADILRQTAGRGRAGMIVLGAYGHSRLRERIFGGVTQSLLRHATVPLLLSH